MCVCVKFVFECASAVCCGGATTVVVVVVVGPVAA